MDESHSPVAERVHELLEPVVESLGVELVDVEWSGGSLKVFIDTPDGVTTETLAEVSHMISPLLDQEDPVPGRYMLEVSSPGVERPLRRLAQFERAVGEDVIVKLQPGSDPRRLRGSLTSVDGETITVEAVELDGNDLAQPESHTIDVDSIDKARTSFEWGPTPKPNSKSGSSAKKGQRPKSN